MTPEQEQEYQERMGSPEMEYLQYQTDFPEQHPPMTTLNTIIEEEKREFERRTQCSAVYIKDVRRWLKENPDTLFGEEIYPESMLELSYEKVKDFLTTSMQRAYEAGRADWLRSEIEKFNRSKRELPKDAVEMMGELGVAEEKLRNFGYNTALTSIITRYKEELKVLESK